MLGNKFYNFGGLGFSQGQNPGAFGNTETMPQNMTSAPVLPNYLGLPFRIIVSPFMRFDPATKCTDIIMFNSSNLGALIVKEDPHVKSWDDPRYNLTEMAIEESYRAIEPRRFERMICDFRSGNTRSYARVGRFATISKLAAEGAAAAINCRKRRLFRAAAAWHRRDSKRP